MLSKCLCLKFIYPVNIQSRDSACLKKQNELFISLKGVKCRFGSPHFIRNLDVMAVNSILEEIVGAVVDRLEEEDCLICLDVVKREERSILPCTHGRLHHEVCMGEWGRGCTLCRPRIPRRGPLEGQFHLFPNAGVGEPVGYYLYADGTVEVLWAVHLPDAGHIIVVDE